MGKRKKGKVLKICKQCGIAFYARHDRPGLYCSRSCAAKNKPKICHRIKKNCEVCNKEFEIKRYRNSTALYCSRECRRKRMPKGEDHKNWKGGIARSWESKVLIKKLIRLKGKCDECNSDKNLQGHHIIPYSINKELQSCENNIQVLCKMCHAKKHPNFANFILKGIIHE